MSCFGDGFISPRAGVVFPRVLGNSPHVYERFTWNLGLQWGGISRSGFGGGGHFAFQWQTSAYASSFDTLSSAFDDVVEEYEFDRELRRFMPNIGGTIVIDPFTRLFVHPSFSGTFGPAMLIYINREYDRERDRSELTEHSGVYWGFIGSLAFDLHLDVGDGNSFFAGFVYQIGQLSKKKWGENIRFVQNLTGPSVHIGFRFQ
jgi:hypothetical protein